MPPAYEVLLLNTAIPQIQAAQSGDTYVVPRDIAFSAALTLSAGTANGVPYLNGSKVVTTGSALTFDGSALRLKAGTDQNLAIGSGGGILGFFALNDAVTSPVPMQFQGEYLRFNTGAPTASEKMRLDSSGRLLVGVTSNTGGANLEVISNGVSAFTARSTSSGASTTVKAVRSVSSDAADFANAQYDALSHGWILSNGSQAMTLDASGRLAIGDTTAAYRLNVHATTDHVGLYDTDVSGLVHVLSGNGNSSLYIGADNGNVAASSNLILAVDGTERARITSGGYFKASDNGSYNSGASNYHEFNQSAALNALEVYAGNANYNANVVIALAARNTTNNSFYYFGAYNTGAAAFKFRVADSGDVTNTNGTYGTISDAKMKTDIVDAGSQWADIKALRFRKFKMKDDPSGLVQLGVVAQEVEQTSPGLVDEHADKDAEGNDLGTTTKSVKTSILLMKAAVALQEAIARIETLEAEVAALKGA